MKVYVIQSNSGSGIELKNHYATLDKDTAKQIIKDEILYSGNEEIFDEKYVDKFAQDLVDGRTKDHYCDEFNGICIWCDILELM